MPHPVHGKPIPLDVFKAARLSSLAYLKFEDTGNPAVQKESQAEVRQACQMLGYPRVDFFWNKETDTQGLIAYTDDGKAVVTFRGTEQVKDRDKWTDIKHDPIAEPKYYGSALVHHGFHEAVDSVYPQIQNSLNKHHAQAVYTTGHSMGGGEAQLAAPRMANDPALAQSKIRVAGVYTFEAPHVSNGRELVQEYRKHGITDVVRVEQKNDIVTRVNSDPSHAAFDGLIGHGPNPLDPKQVAQRAWWGYESAQKFFNPYYSGIGGCPPHGDHSATVGNYVYIASDDRIRWNPSGDDCAADRRAVFAHKPLGVIQQHFQYDQHLFGNMTHQEKHAWRNGLEAQRTTAEEHFYKPHATAEQRATALASWNAVRREQESLEGREWRTQPMLSREQVEQRHRLEVERNALEPKFCSATDPAERRALERQWNTNRRNAEAIDGHGWIDHHDRRSDFSFEKRGGAASRNGGVSETLKVRGTIHHVSEAPINWCEDIRHGNEKTVQLVDEQMAHGKRPIIAPEFGVDPREPLNYDHRANTYSYGGLEAELKRSAGLKDQRQLSPLDVRVALRGTTDKQGNRLEFPPEVTVTDREQRVLSCYLEDRWSEKGQDRTQIDAVELSECPIGSRELAAARREQGKNPPAAMTQQTASQQAETEDEEKKQTPKKGARTKGKGR
jgi:hypothetical protein